MMFGAPVIYSDLLTQTAQNPKATESLRGVICGGAVVPAALVQALLKRNIILTVGFFFGEKEFREKNIEINEQRYVV